MSKKALRDPDRGIDRMQVGYFVGDQGEIIERHLDANSRLPPKQALPAPPSYPYY